MDSVLQIRVQGIRNVLNTLGMLMAEPVTPLSQANIRKAYWLRAAVDGILNFHVSTRDFVKVGQSIVTNCSILGVEQNSITATTSGIILGMTAIPAVKPGEPICHFAQLTNVQRNRCRKKPGGSSNKFFREL